MAFSKSGGVGAGAGGQITLDQISGAFGNFKYVDEASDIPLVSGEHEIPAGTTIEFVDNAITGQAPLFFNPLRIQDNQNCVIQAPLTLNAIVYLGATPFINRDDLGFYIQNNIIIAAPSADCYSIVNTVFTPQGDASFFIDNFAFFGKSLGLVVGMDVVSMNGVNVLDWLNGFILRDCTSVDADTLVSSGTPTGAGAYLTIEGDKTIAVSIRGGTPAITTGQSFINLSPNLNDQCRFVVSNNEFNSAFGGDFFEQGNQGLISAYADNSSTGSITAFADNGSGGTTVTSAAHGLVDDRKITITLTTNYNGTHKLFNVTANTFDIPVAFVADDATGTWNFNSVTVTSTAHGNSDGDALQISKSTNYNFGRVIFGVAANTFNIDDVPFNGDDAAGEWDSGSIKQNDPRMVCSGNGDQPDTSQLLAADITSTEVLATTNPEALFSTWSGTVDNQFTLNPPGEPTGTIRYEGRDISGGLTLSVVYIATSGNPGAAISFRVYRSTGGGGYVQVNSNIPGFLENKENTVTWLLESPLVDGDLLQVRAFDAANNSIDIEAASLVVRSFAQGI